MGPSSIKCFSLPSDFFFRNSCKSDYLTWTLTSLENEIVVSSGSFRVKNDWYEVYWADRDKNSAWIDEFGNIQLRILLKHIMRWMCTISLPFWCLFDSIYFNFNDFDVNFPQQLEIISISSTFAFVCIVDGTARWVN